NNKYLKIKAVEFDNKKYGGDLYAVKIHDRICVNYYDTENKFFKISRAGTLIGCHFLQDPATLLNNNKENNCVQQARKESLYSFPVANILNKCFLDKATSAVNSNFAIKIQQYIKIFAAVFSITFIIKIGIEIMQGQITIKTFMVNLIKLTIILTISLQDVEYNQNFNNYQNYAKTNIAKIYHTLTEIAKELPINLLNSDNSKDKLCSFSESEYTNVLKENLKITMTLDTISCKIMHLTFLDQFFSGNLGQISLTVVFIVLIIIGILSKMPFLIILGMLPYATLFSVLTEFLTLYISSQFLLILLTMLAPLFLIFWYFELL
ncbi:MAG: hypothetical protein U1E31_01145, partial [Rickettsiales bacterium]